MNRRSMLLLLAATLGLAPLAGRAGDGFGLMPMDEVERALSQKTVTVYDANVPEIWERHHLPGAIPVAGKDLGKLLPADKGARVVFYCTNPK